MSSRHARIRSAAAGLCLAAAAASSPAAAAPAGAEGRGELLYRTHCIACHTTQMHWRERQLAVDWASLAAQVRRWQAVGFLQWSEDDVLEVTRYLNDAIYHFPLGSEPLAAVTGP